MKESGEGGFPPQVMGEEFGDVTTRNVVFDNLYVCTRVLAPILVKFIFNSRTF